MSSRRRQNRESTVPASSSHVRSTAGTGAAAPPYELPEYPLTDTAQRQLASLLHSHKLKELEALTQEAKEVLINNAAEVNERLTGKRERLSKRKRQAEDQENVAPEENTQLEELQRALDTYTKEVQASTKSLDSGLRRLIDAEYHTQSVKEVVESLAAEAAATAGTQISTNAQSQRRSARRNHDEEMADEEPPDFTPTDPTSGTQIPQAPITIFRTRCDTAKTKYTMKSLDERYRTNDDYRSMRQLVHDAMYPNEDVPMPEPHTWFNQGPPPAPGVTTRGDDDDDEEDIALISAKTSTKCPVTLREFVKPLTSKRCKHSYEADAIRQLIRQGRNEPGRGRVAQCPVGGCNHSTSEADLYEDRLLIRKIKRIQNARQMAEVEDDDDEINRGGRTQGTIELNNDEDDFGEDVDALWQRTQAPPPKREPVSSTR